MSKLEQLINNYSNTFASILPFDFSKNNVLKIDLSIGNSELANIQTISTDILSEYINSQLKKLNKTIAVGGYNENRVIYNKSELFKNSEDARTIHLGTDVWCQANSNVSAPLASTVHSFNNNDNFGDYGPTIILEHKLEGQSFFTLYGHLTKASLNHLTKGQKIKKGEVFTQVGNATENGNWPPHLHFQLISNIMDYEGDFPGVSSQLERNKWLEICPNPELFFRNR